MKGCIVLFYSSEAKVGGVEKAARAGLRQDQPFVYRTFEYTLSKVSVLK